MHCFQALLLPCFQYFHYFCNIFQYFQYIFCNFFVLSKHWKKKGQNWTKNKLDFLYELLHQYICGFLQLLLIEMHITKTQKTLTQFSSFQISVFDCFRSKCDFKIWQSIAIKAEELIIRKIVGTLLCSSLLELCGQSLRSII